MTFKEYIETKYDVKETIKARTSDPIKAVLDNDDFEFDEIRMVDGELQKVVYINEEEFITVFELLCYSEKDIPNMSPELREVYTNYMQDITVEKWSLEALRQSARAYRKERRRAQSIQ